MDLKQEVRDAFATFGLTPDAPQIEASKAYRKLALQNHPDKKIGDPRATERFQEVRMLGRFFTSPFTLFTSIGPHAVDRRCLVYLPKALRGTTI